MAKELNKPGRKPTGLKRKQQQISLPPDLYAKLKAHGQPSKLIQKLLAEYFYDSQRPLKPGQ